MKRLIITLNLSLLLIAASSELTIALGQNRPGKQRTLHIKVVDKKGRPVAPGTVRAFVNQGDMLGTDSEGRMRFGNVTDADSVYFAVDANLYAVSAAGMDSITLTVNKKNISHFRARSAEGVVQADSSNDTYGTLKKVDPHSVRGPAGTLTNSTTIQEYILRNYSGVYQDGDKIKIRGVHSVTSSTDPLIVLDGAYVSSLDVVQPWEVESISVLKDGSAYGSRGAAGVIIIRTKASGASQK